jgi:putative membrane protein
MLNYSLPVVIVTAIALSTLCSVFPQASWAANPLEGLAQGTADPKAIPDPVIPADPVPALPIPSVPASQAEIDSQDQQFAIQAAQGGMAEVELGRLAAQKAASPVIQNYGQQMVQEHTQVNNQLKQLAAKKGIKLPTDVDPQKESTKARLSKLSGADFDREYINQMVVDHQKTVSLFEQQAKNGQDPELKAWATQTLPNLQAHLRQAVSTQRNIAQQSTLK